MPCREYSVLLLALALSGCRQAPGDLPKYQPLSARRESAINVDVRGFAADVARDVSQEGPAAWQKYFSDRPAFFMAADGVLQFPDRAAATAGIQALTRTIRHIDLKWGDDLRVDALAPDLAMIATSYHEDIVTSSGAHVDSNGYFTGVVEFRGSGWRFRNAHWSSARTGSGTGTAAK